MKQDNTREPFNKERAREILKEMKNARVVYLQDLSIVKTEKRTERRNQEAQALDIAIESLDNEQKKASITLEELKNKYDKKLEKALAECETGVQANAICEVTNVLIDYILDNEWVDVKDRLPSESGTYLVSLNGVWKKDYCKFWFFGKGENGEMGWDEFEGYENIIAWKPLPQPYERKE